MAASFASMASSFLLSHKEASKSVKQKIELRFRINDKTLLHNFKQFINVQDKNKNGSD